MASNIHLGIDTGGTYTDAVLIDHTSRSILARAKAITTKGNLADGVGNAMASVLSAAGPHFDRSSIAAVSLSTTLATNAVVEGHGAPVTAILIGFDDAMASRTMISTSLRDAKVVRISGGHDHNGDIRLKLDLTSLETEVLGVDSISSAYAVASTFAVRNPAHEKAARDLIERLTGKPVTLSSELSTDLDAPRRALTAVLNARLIPRISQLIAAVRTAMSSHGIVSPLMIVRGDGSVANADAVALRPIETVLSGPAASVIGAKWLCKADSFIMSDIGGTTTDVAVVENGMPRIALRGAEVGGWRTMVRAIDVKTIGLGGDSEVTIAVNGAVATSTQRAVPVSLLGTHYPALLQMLEQDMAESTGGSHLGRFVCLPFGITQNVGAVQTGSREAEILARLQDGPIPLRKIAVSSAAQRAVSALRGKGLLQVAAFTPSDAAHVLGMQDNWSESCAILTARLICRHRDMKDPSEERVRAFCQEVFNAVVTQSARVIMHTILPPADSGSTLVDHIAEGRRMTGLAEISIRPTIPIVAVGGPATIYYPEVARRLGCELILVDDAAVANSIGAATGTVAHRAVVSVEGDGSGVFKVFDGRSAQTFSSGSDALEFAMAQSRAIAKEISASFGASECVIILDVQKSHLPDAIGDDGLLSATVTASASARTTSA
jgi:N-methylhydantoinase A/oxoprolinase/acetone carboxylase beta subunit